MTLLMLFSLSFPFAFKQLYRQERNSNRRQDKKTFFHPHHRASSYSGLWYFLSYGRKRKVIYCEISRDKLLEGKARERENILRAKKFQERFQGNQSLFQFESLRNFCCTRQSFSLTLILLSAVVEEKGKGRKKDCFLLWKENVSSSLHLTSTQKRKKIIHLIWDQQRERYRFRWRRRT